MTDRPERREWVVTGMDCAACTVKVTRAVERLPGVSEVRVALMAERLSLDLAPEPVSFDLGAGAGLPGIPLRLLWREDGT